MAQLTMDTENLIRKLFNSADVFILYLDNAGSVLVCNDKVEKITGRPRQEIIGKSWSGLLYHPDEGMKQQMFKAVMENSLTHKMPNSFEGTLSGPDGKRSYICWNITPITGKDNEPQGLLLVGNDISSLKDREESFQKIDDTLKDIISSIKEYALFATNLEGNITYFGMGSELMFGWQKSEIAFKNASILFADNQEINLTGFMQRVKQSGSYACELELVRKDNLSFPVNISGSRFIDPDGKPAGFIFIAKDITDEKKLEYQVFQAEKMAAIGQLAAGMAHEINNPLFVISGRLEMILSDKRIGKKLKENLVIVSEQAERIRKLVDRLLKFSRKSLPKLDALNINEVIEGVLPLLSYYKLPSASIEIEKHFALALPAVKGDLNQLQEVFLNLLINACQAMPEGGKVVISTDNQENKFALIKISDSGKGIPQESVKNVFMPFFSTKKDGTGLGLSICYAIIRAHYGTIDMDSRIDKGTTFTIKLPFV